MSNLATLFKRFTSSNPMDPMAAQLRRTGTLVGQIKGAPLRCSLRGAKATSPGLLVTGQAVGSPGALTGQGFMSEYEPLLAGFKPKFAIYEQAHKINRTPWLIDLAIARGNRGPRLVQRMSRVLEEKANPARLFTWRSA